MQDKIIQYLKQHQGFLSGEEISRNLNVSRAGIWKSIQELRNQGYVIDAAARRGYCLSTIPDKLLPREILFGLKTSIMGKKIYYFDSIESTMDKAFELGTKGEKDGTIVCAEAQSKGKGRLGRHWNSPKGRGIYFSMILRPNLAPPEAVFSTLLSAVAVCEAIRKVSGLDAKIKWPNDILINGQKVCGILTELSAEIDRLRFIAVGIGVNVNTPLSLLPPKAGSLRNGHAKKISRIELLQEILVSFEKWYQCLTTRKFEAIRQRWKELSLTLGKRVELVDVTGSIKGKAIDIDEYGGLIIRRDSGVIVKRMSGDVL